MYCPNCGSNNDDGNQFCGKCGKPLQIQQPGKAQLPPPLSYKSPEKHSQKPRSGWKKTFIIIGSIVGVLILMFFIGLFTGYIMITPANPATQQPISTIAELTVEPSLSVTQEPKSTEIPTQASAPIIQTNAPLSSSWCLIYTTFDEGLMAANFDGSGTNKIFKLPIPYQGTWDIPSGLGGYPVLLAIRSARDSGNGWDLDILDLNGLQTEKIAPLISDELLKNGIDPNLGSAVSDSNAIRWSPSGHYLVFTAAIDGPSTDLYLYDISTKEISRLTSGDLEVATPFWTLDNEQIIYQAVETFGSGAGWTAKSVWIIDRDGTRNHKLFDITTPVTWADFIGFVNKNTLLVNMKGQYSRDLRLVDIDHGDLTILANGSVSSVSFDPKTSSIAFIGPDGHLYYTPQADMPPVQVGNDDFTDYVVSWNSSIQEFVILGKGGAYFLSVNGELIQKYNNSAILTTSSNGEILCEAGDSLLCKKGLGEVQTVTTSSNVKVFWSSWDDGEFFYVDGTSLYYVSTQDFKPKLIDNNLVPVNYIPGTLFLEGIGEVVGPG